jgi:hypothetical protein
MKIDIKEDKYIISELDYEMVQVILNGLECERKRFVEKISVLTTYLFKDYPESTKEEFRVQIEYLKEKNDELLLSIKNLSEQIELLPLINKNPQFPLGDNLT